MNMYEKIEKVSSIRSELGEGPCWDEIEKTIYWVDIIKKNIHSYNFEKNIENTISLKKYVGSIGLRKTGGLIAAIEDGFYFINEKSENIKLIKNVSGNINKRFNDGKVDALGNFWAGSVSLDEKQPIGRMYCLKSNLEMIELFNSITISNGIAWSLDNKKMYYIDTPTMSVDVFDFDIENSNLSHRRTLLKIPREIGYPDGMTIDIDDKLWIAHWGGYQVCRWDPDTKKILERIKIPAKRVSCCSFGGNDLSDLFITTAKSGFTENINETNDKDSGFLYKIPTKTIGLKSFRFSY